MKSIKASIAKTWVTFEDSTRSKKNLYRFHCISILEHGEKLMNLFWEIEISTRVNINHEIN